MRKEFYLTETISDIEDDIFGIRFRAIIELEPYEILLHILTFSRYTRNQIIQHLKICVSSLKLDYLGEEELEKICNEDGFINYNIYEIRKEK